MNKSIAQIKLELHKATGGALPIGPPADVAAKLAALKEQMRQQGTDFNRRMQGVVNAEKTAGSGTVLPTDKAKGGKIEVRPTVFDDAASRRNPNIESAARALAEGKITKATYAKIVAKEKPVAPYDFIPKPATDEQAMNVLIDRQKQNWKSHNSWPAGHRVGLRLDIPAYERHGVWVNSIHDESGGQDKFPTSYGSVSSVRNATFEGSPSKAIRVATGEQTKTPFAKIKGELEHIDEDKAVKHFQKYLNHPDYVQVGYDPRRHGDFYDRKTMKPVTHSEHVVQIGPLVLAKNPVYGKRTLYSHGGAAHSQHYAQGGNVNAFDYEKPEHVRAIASHVAKHKDFNQVTDAAKHLGEMLATGNWRHIEDPRFQHAIRQSGHTGYYALEKTGKKLHSLPPYIAHKAVGGTMDTPDLAQSRLNINQRANPALMDNIGINEALDMSPKTFISPEPRMGNTLPVGGVEKVGGLPIGGVDQSSAYGMQFAPQALQGQQQAPDGTQGGLPPSSGASSPAQQQPSNMLSLTPQGRALGAMAPQGMAKGGIAKQRAEIKFRLDQLAKGGQPKKVTKPYDEIGQDKRVMFKGEGYGDVKGIVVPRHMWEGNKASGNKKIHGMDEINKARAKVYGEENREPLHIGQVGRLHKQVLNNHFAKPLQEQLVAEKNALAKLREAKHIGKNADTLDKSEKLDTVNHEYDDQGRSYKGFASKGVAGSSLYTSGHGDNRKFHIINTCPGQTVGCGGGHDEHGIVDTMKGTCFAPNAESQYAAAAVRRAAHEQAKHDPAMTSDWILAHTGSLRDAARVADKQNKRLLFRPNVVDETDVSSRHVLRHLNEQRKKDKLPPITANSYGKTNELHDPENGYHVTHSNIGPKVKQGQSIQESIGKDKQRVRNTIMAADNKGDFVNEQGHKTPPKGSYMVTDVKRGSQLGRDMAKHITHAKYWTTGRTAKELTEEERSEPETAHYGPKGDSTTPDKAHYGHTTLEGKRFDYQKQHILHPRLVQVGHNDDGTPHMIPTDSRFKDEDFLPKNRFMTKNGKKAGHILMTTPTESTSTLGAQTSFTHHVGPEHVEHAKKNKGEYEIDSPTAQIQAEGKEYVAPQPIQILKKTKKFALGGVVIADSDDGLNDDDFHAFPERNFAAQHHLANRMGVESVNELHPFQLHNHKA